MVELKNVNREEANIKVLSILPSLSKEEQVLITNSLKIYSYANKNVIFIEGGTPSGLVCLLEGSVKIHKTGLFNKSQIVRMATPIGFIGYRALFAKENYISSAQAISDCVVAIIPKDVLFSIMESNTALCLDILQSLAKELGVSNKKTITLVQKHVRGRLADALLGLVNLYGYESDGSTINIVISRNEYAHLSNMTTSNAIRTLSAFSDEGVIEIIKKKVRILSIEKLKHISYNG